MNDKLKVMLDKVQEKKVKEQVIKDKFKDLNKKKKLTQEQRISRIEEILGIE